jgi:hypothetical protein
MKLNLKIVTAAAAVAMMSSGAAFAAATVATSPLASYTYSKEGLALTAGAVTLPDIVVTFGNNLTYQDDIYITLPGTTSVAAVPSAGLVTCLPAGGAVGYVTTVAGGWNFRVTAVSGINLGDTCTFVGLQVTAASLSSAAPISLKYQANRFQTGQLVDQASSLTAILVKSQFALTTQQALNGIINVQTDRKSFANAETVAPGNVPTTTLNDTLNFTTTVDGAGTTFTGPTATPTATTIQIAGDWSWVDGADVGATCEVAEFGAVLNGYAGWGVSATSTCANLVLTQTYPLPGNTQVMTGWVDVPGTVALNTTDWIGNVEWKYNLTGNTAITGLTSSVWDPGIWTINGAQVYIQYMPWGTNISRIIYAANTGVQPAQVSGTLYYNGNTYQCSLGTAVGKTVTELSGPVNTCVANAGITTGKVAILLTFTAPDKDIEVYSAYNVGGNDRGTVVNTSNGRTFFYGTGFPFVPPGP